MEERSTPPIFISYLQGEGIWREFSCRHTPQQNGVAERKNRRILEVARAMMREKHMPNFYWAEAASMAVYLMNRCTTNGVHELIPFEIFSGRNGLSSRTSKCSEALRIYASRTQIERSLTRSRRNVSS